MIFHIQSGTTTPIEYHNILKDGLYRQTFNPPTAPQEQPYRPPARSTYQTHPLRGNTGVRINTTIPSAPPAVPTPEAPTRRSVIERLPIIQPTQVDQEFRNIRVQEDYHPLTQPQYRMPREDNRTHACTVIKENPLNRRPQMAMIRDTVDEYYENDGANANHITPAMRPIIQRP